MKTKSERGISTAAAVVITAIVVGVIVGGGAWVLKPAVYKEKPGKGIRIDYINQASGKDPVFAAVTQGFRDFCDPMGIKLVTRHAEGEVAKMPGWIDSAVAAGTDGIVVTGFVPATLDPPIKRAVDAGVPVIVNIVDTAGTSRSAFIGVGDLVGLGKMKAKPLNPYLENGSWVLAPMEQLTVRPLTYVEAAENYWRNNMGIEVNIKNLETTNDISTAEDRVTSELTANPGKYDAILANGGISTAASNLAEKNAGIEPGEIPITGLDFLDPTVGGIREGRTVGVICWQPYTSGYLPAAVLYQKIKWNLAMPKQIDTGIKLVDKSNLEGFLEYVDINRW